MQTIFTVLISLIFSSATLAEDSASISYEMLEDDSHRFYERLDVPFTTTLDPENESIFYRTKTLSTVDGSTRFTCEKKYASGLEMETECQFHFDGNSSDENVVLMSEVVSPKVVVLDIIDRESNDLFSSKLLSPFTCIQVNETATIDINGQPVTGPRLRMNCEAPSDLDKKCRIVYIRPSDIEL